LEDYGNLFQGLLGKNAQLDFSQRFSKRFLKTRMDISFQGFEKDYNGNSFPRFLKTTMEVTFQGFFKTIFEKDVQTGSHWACQFVYWCFW